MSFAHFVNFVHSLLWIQVFAYLAKAHFAKPFLFSTQFFIILSSSFLSSL